MIAPGLRYLAGIDGGGTRTTVVLADAKGRELLRRSGSEGRIDSRDPAAAARTVAALLRDALAEAGVPAPIEALCAGLAGAGNGAEREQVQVALGASGLARRVRVVSDGEAALEGALGNRAGILLVAGTGSIAYGRGSDGRVERCGGWGMAVGDEGGGYAIGRAGIRAALRSADGRGPATQLLPCFRELLGLATVEAIPPWVERAEKAEIAALAIRVVELAGTGDTVSAAVLDKEADALALHAAALAGRLAPWPEDPVIVFHGGMLRAPLYAERVRRALAERLPSFALRSAEADPLAGALRYAARMVQPSSV